MNSLFNHALKQEKALRQDLGIFQRGEDTSVAMQGQIAAKVNAFKRSIDDYESMARKEMIAARREAAIERVGKFREEYDEIYKSFTRLKNREEQASNRAQLLERRQSRLNVPVEHPYQAVSSSPYLQQAQAYRERDFAQRTGQQLDEMLHQGRNALENLYQQRTMLKSTQRKLLDAANTLGLSRNVIQLIERRSTEDKWIFYAGVCITLFCMWAIVHYLT
ncbi:protein transport protein bos1 [Actinomortierella wolfii]|nr:protein transport protein bos1 [Actinomortierella wolfii]KAG0241996.1 protein transport protein bos1 [Actinomortierella wolfii]